MAHPAAALAEDNLDLVDRCRSVARARYDDLPGDTTLGGVGREALWRAALRYDHDSPATFRTYAWHRIMGSLLDARRRQYRSADALAARRVPRVSAAVLEYEAGPPVRRGRPDELVSIRREARELLGQLTRRLDAVTRAIVIGHLVEERSLREMAALTGLTYKVTRRRYREALAAIEAIRSAERPAPPASR